MKTTINFILDKSGSMTSVWDATINGFNEYLQELRKDQNDYDIRLTLFDTETSVGEKQDIKDFKDLNRQTYHPNGGTALYDAACKTMSAITDDGKQLIVIMTDGEENSSREYSMEQFKALKSDLEKKGNFTFVFLGANQDAWANAQQWGFNKQNVSNFNASAAGMRSASANLASATAGLAASGSMSTTIMFSAKQQREMEETK